MSMQLSTWLRSPVASDRDFKPTACSPRPGIGSVRETDPSAITSWSYASSSACPSSRRTASVARAGSAPSTRPTISSVCRSSLRSETTTWRGSSVAPAAPGKSGV